MRITSKLQDVHQDLNLLAGQGKVKGFFNNIENAEKLGGLVEDIRDAMMEYQVCLGGPHMPQAPLTFALPQTSLQQDIYSKSCQIIVSLISSPFTLTG